VHGAGGEQGGGIGPGLIGARRVDVVDGSHAGKGCLFRRRKLDAVENDPGRRVIGWLQVLETDVAYVIASAESGRTADIGIGIVQGVYFPEESPEWIILATARANFSGS
jgi:hypothetical protein